MKKQIALLITSAVILGGLSGCTEEKRVEETDGRIEESVSVQEETYEETEKPQETEAETETTEPDAEPSVMVGIPQTPVELGTWKESMLEDLTLPGLWTVPEDTTVPGDLETLFDEIDDDYTPVALVGIEESIDDDSCNYCLLCKGVSGYVDYWFYLFVNKDAQGNYSFCNTYAFDLQQGLEADIEETYLPDHPEYLGVWELSDDGVITDELLEIYNSAYGINDMYKRPIAFLGQQTVDDITSYCFLTEGNLYFSSNNIPMLTYISEGGEGIYVEFERSSFTFSLMSQCPEISSSELPMRSSFFYTYGVWTVPQSKDISNVPSEIIDMVNAEGYTPVSYVLYRELLHPDNTCLIRALFCQDSNGNAAFVLTKEDDTGIISIASEASFGLETVAEDSIVKAEDIPDNTGWIIDITTDIPAELTSAYNILAAQPTRIMNYGAPEYLIGTKIEDDGISYFFMSDELLTSYSCNGYIDLVVIKLDINGNILDERSVEVNMDGILSPDLNPDEGSTIDSTLSYVYAAAITVDPTLATELVNDDNRDETGITVNCSNIDVAIQSFETREDAEAVWGSWKTAFQSSMVYEGNNYFTSDSFVNGGGNLYNYVFLTQNDVVLIQTADLYQVTTVANIGDTLAATLP